MHGGLSTFSGFKHHVASICEHLEVAGGGLLCLGLARGVHTAH